MKDIPVKYCVLNVCFLLSSLSTFSMDHPKLYRNRKQVAPYKQQVTYYDEQISSGVMSQTDFNNLRTNKKLKASFAGKNVYILSAKDVNRYERQSSLIVSTIVPTLLVQGLLLNMGAASISSMVFSDALLCIGNVAYMHYLKSKGELVTL